MNFERIAIIIIFVLHAVGAVGVLLGKGDLIWPLTPVNLLISGLLSLALAWSERTVWWIWVMAVGILAEIVGVQTGLLFGNYHYGEVLGPTIFGVPLLLGWMWLLLLQGSRDPGLPRLREALTGACWMTAMDLLIEPIAVRAGWWAWEAEPEGSWLGYGLHVAGQIIPTWNFVSWWLVSFLLLLVAPSCHAPLPYRVWRTMWWTMAAFFLILNLFHWT